MITVECVHEDKHEVEIAPGYSVKVCLKCAKYVLKQVAIAHKLSEMVEMRNNSSLDDVLPWGENGHWGGGKHA